MPPDRDDADDAICFFIRDQIIRIILLPCIDAKQLVEDIIKGLTIPPSLAINHLKVATMK